MRFTGKRISALLLAGWIAFNSAGCRTITGYQNLSGEHSEKTGLNQVEDVKLSVSDYIAFKEKLSAQIKTSQVILDKETDGFIASIYIDGTGIKIILTDGSVVEGDVEHLKLSGLNLQNLYVVDTQFQEDVCSQKFGDYSETAREYDKHLADYEYEINTVAYMIPVSDNSTRYTFLQPYEAELQRDGLSTSVQSDYDVYSSNDSLKSNYINNSTIAINNARLMYILFSFGIIRRVSDWRLKKIQEMADRTVNSVSPYWSEADYGDWYYSIKNRDSKEVVDNGEYR